MKIKHIFKGYNYFYKQRYGAESSFTPHNEKICEKFLKLLEERYNSLERVGEEYLWNYFVFQFSYWKDLEIKSFNKKINLTFIIGEKAFKRYIERNTEYDWQIAEKEREYSRELFHQSLGLHSKNDSNYDCDQIYREMDFNSEKGLSTCLVYTSLFNPHSSSCQSCIYQLECKEVQQTIYPHIYKNRIIENESRATG